ncbi:unnamed protein product [Vitrella brassicaformis CCMP3155]|uniref:Uncharacterized protein n=1 Tax=Vitrella brassicaformis (strain CCMP3155) TaxID=1169540 RepID=A0A0G4ESI7_VITBC|nr:unnamed protein product [Vitrella brassicaformis CCMP3155]|eukprot:CEM00957.1 unnamed protein product [Vitrella brassicaformis CCMP3155]
MRLLAAVVGVQVRTSSFDERKFARSSRREADLRFDAPSLHIHRRISCRSPLRQVSECCRPRLVRISSFPPLQPSPSLSRHHHYHRHHHHGATMENLPPFATGRPLSRPAEQKQKQKQQKEAEDAPQHPEKKERKVEIATKSVPKSLLKRKKAKVPRLRLVVEPRRRHLDLHLPVGVGLAGVAAAAVTSRRWRWVSEGRRGPRIGDVAEVDPEDALVKLLAKFRRVDELIKAAPEPQSREQQERISEVDRQYRVLSSTVCADAGKHFRTLDAMEHTLNDTEQSKSSVKKPGGRTRRARARRRAAGGIRSRASCHAKRSSRRVGPNHLPQHLQQSQQRLLLLAHPTVWLARACRRLSREELANVFAHLQPWELARLRRHLGKALFHQSAANYTHLVIDCKDETARQMWAAMPLATAHKWGQRMTHLNRLRVRAPFDRPGWGLGHLVAVTEGHADGRAALAAKQQQQQHQSAEREASGGVAISTQSGDDGTLEELSFESVLILPTPPPTPGPLLAPSPIKTISFPALTTVTAVPREVARIRTGRSWLTPNLSTLTFEREALFHQSAANYTHLVIDCKDETARQMWAAMPLATAHKWGQRMTHLNRLRVRAPFDRPGWGLGHWVAVTEGHADGRAALAAKQQQQQHQSAEKEASGGVAISTQSGDDGTLEELSFESVPISPVPPPTPGPLPAPSPIKTINLPALTTVTAVPREVARIRTGRSWLTPNLATITFEGQVDTEAAKEWVKGCKGLKGMGGLSVRATEEVLRVLPEDGKPLSSLRFLRGVELWSADADAICRLRETLVARGAKGTLDFSSLHIFPPRDPSWHEYHQMVRDRNRIQELAELTADVVDADALKEPIPRCRHVSGSIAAGLVTWAHSNRCPWVRYIVNYLANGAIIVVVSGDEGTAATITSDTIPSARAIEVAAGALATAEKRAAAASIASVIAMRVGWQLIVGSFSSPLTSAVGVVDFLTAVKSTEKIISLQVHLSAAAVSSAAELSGWQLGRRAADMLSMWMVRFTVYGEVDDGECGAVLCNAIAILTSCTQLKGVKNVTKCFPSGGLASKMQHRFRPEAPEGFDTEFSMGSLTFQRRSP